MDLRPEADPRDPAMLEDHSAAVRATVRAMRLACLHQTWAERCLSAFDQLVTMWHPMDPTLYLGLEDAPRRRAEAILERAGYL